MIITKIEVKGKNKEAAIVTFKKGFNVIAGASDTGKSYIIQCLKFIFGSKRPPNAIKQSKGYTSLEVTFEDNNGKEFVLKRELKKDSDITLVEPEADNLTTILKPTHQGKKNLSSFFMKKIGLEKMVLVRGGESLNHASLTLRVLEKIFIVDESRIITEESPLGTGQNNEKTLETSLLKSLLTGEDDSEVLDLKGRKESKRTLKSKIDNLQDVLSRYFSGSTSETVTIASINDDLESLESSIQKAEQELNAMLKENRGNIEKRNSLLTKSTELSAKIDDDSTVLERFDLLMKKYVSDKERLEAGSEAVKYIDNHYLATCPTCGHELEENESELSVELVLAGNLSEIQKTNRKIDELNATIKEIISHREERLEQLDIINDEIQEIDNVLDSSIAEKIRVTNSVIKDLSSKRAELRYKSENEERKKNILQEIGGLQTEHDATTDVYEIPDFSAELKEFMKEISEILVRWDFPEGKLVGFDRDARDIVVGDKPRSHYGKGYRAICFASFVIGLMNYLVEKGRHPGFIVLDSPLTTYKHRDEEVLPMDEEDEQEDIARNLIYAFYRDLCDFYKDKQIIVLDNQEPSEDLIQLMNYTHFSKNENIGRYGFFPV